MKQFLILFILGAGLLTVSITACTSQNQTRGEGRLDYDPNARLTNIEQVPGNYVTIVPESISEYRSLMRAFLEGEDGGHPVGAVRWVGVSIIQEPNQAAVRYHGSQAGETVSRLGSIQQMRIEDRVAYVQLTAHEREDALEIAIAEPVVRETLLAFDVIDRVEFKP